MANNILYKYAVGKAASLIQSENITLSATHNVKYKRFQNMYAAFVAEAKTYYRLIEAINEVPDSNDATYDPDAPRIGVFFQLDKTLLFQAPRELAFGEFRCNNGDRVMALQGEYQGSRIFTTQAVLELLVFLASLQNFDVFIISKDKHSGLWDAFCKNTAAHVKDTMFGYRLNEMITHLINKHHLTPQKCLYVGELPTEKGSEKKLSIGGLATIEPPKRKAQ